MLYTASLWSGLADGVVSCAPPHFQISNWGARDLDGQYSTDLRLIFVFFSFIRPALRGAHTKKKILK